MPQLKQYANRPPGVLLLFQFHDSEVGTVQQYRTSYKKPPASFSMLEKQYSVCWLMNSLIDASTQKVKVQQTQTRKKKKYRADITHSPPFL